MDVRSTLILSTGRLPAETFSCSLYSHNKADMPRALRPVTIGCVSIGIAIVGLVQVGAKPVEIRAEVIIAHTPASCSHARRLYLVAEKPIAGLALRLCDRTYTNQRVVAETRPIRNTEDSSRRAFTGSKRTSPRTAMVRVAYFLAIKTAEQFPYGRDL